MKIANKKMTNVFKRNCSKVRQLFPSLRYIISSSHRLHARWFAILFLGATTLAYADSERIVHYQYDTAGNLTGITSAVNQNPPDVISVSPTFINIGQTLSITATGTDLGGVDVSVVATGLSISDIVTSPTVVTFILTASSSAELGNEILTFTSRLGTDSESIVIAEQIEGITTQPDPISVAADGQPSQVKLIFDGPSATEEIYSLSITDTVIATVVQSTITVPQGASEAIIDITGLLDGNTELVLVNVSQFFFIKFPVYVAAKFSGDGENFSAPVGIIVGAEDESGVNNNPVLSSAVGITVSSGGENNPVLSSAIGITVGSGGENNSLISMNSGLSVGPVLNLVQPISMNPGTLVNFTISGLELGSVDAVIIEPADDLTLSGLTINPEGTEISFSIDADAAALTGLRTISVTSPSGEIQTLTSAPLQLTIE